MRFKAYKKRLEQMILFVGTICLSGCNPILFNPKGQVGLEQRSLILIVISLMLIIVVPAILMIIIFSLKYRESHKYAKYCPNWFQSNKIEAIIWTGPILIILILSILTWKTTHFLEPSAPLSHDKKPIIIEAISMDWKWLFIYPDYGIATINEISFPIKTPVHFKVTSNSVMNSFFIPQLGSQIYAMAGMQTNLYLVANEKGIYNGISSNYSGSGFSGMKFTAIIYPDYESFFHWIEKTKKSLSTIENMSSFEEIAIPSEFNKVEYFSKVKPDLFKDIINKYMNDNKNRQLKYKKLFNNN